MRFGKTCGLEQVEQTAERERPTTASRRGTRPVRRRAAWKKVEQAAERERPSTAMSPRRADRLKVCGPEEVEQTAEREQVHNGEVTAAYGPLEGVRTGRSRAGAKTVRPQGVEPAQCEAVEGEAAEG
ncbi:hypothetical protein Ahu01nite_083460 [Winogradskya humida]|uniref:Uncharacterized protein n=1 Tax=Winogradskya humida TaxID=113566 RepID=A0ABQ4A312_9ACTN|nr:hypothetical protein Ahu01nite_083460 [Actinoplanes humidus]